MQNPELRTADLPASKNASTQRKAGLIRRMRERRSARRVRRRERILSGLRTGKRKRKAALAMSASVMAVSSVASPAMVGIQRAAIVDVVETRQPAAKLKVSEAMKEAMIEEEGVRYVVYRDAAGHPTVGVGHLVKPEDGLNVGDGVTRDQVLDFLEQDLKIAEAVVERLTGDLPLYQHEYDALVDLAFNVGEGNVSPGKSPRLNAAIGARDYEAMADELVYIRAGSAVAKGLIERSERRTAIFVDGNYDNPRETSAA